MPASTLQVHDVVVGPFEVNCWIAWIDTPAALVIDPGADAPAVLDALRTRGLWPAAYVLTHGHMDHVSGLADLVDAMPAPAYIHDADLPWAFLADNAMPPYYPAPRRPSGPIHAFRDGDTLALAGMSVTVLSTPGHTPGSVCLHLASHRALFSGDTLFAGSVGRTDFPGGDSRAMQRSLRRLAALPPETRVMAGHGPVSTIGNEVATNYFMQLPASSR